MYSKKSQSELIENKDFNMELLLPHNTAKIKYFRKFLVLEFFIGYQRALCLFQVLTNGNKSVNQVSNYLQVTKITIISTFIKPLA